MLYCNDKLHIMIFGIPIWLYGYLIITIILAFAQYKIFSIILQEDVSLFGKFLIVSYPSVSILAQISLLLYFKNDVGFVFNSLSILVIIFQSFAPIVSYFKIESKLSQKTGNRLGNASWLLPLLITLVFFPLNYIGLKNSSPIQLDRIDISTIENSINNITATINELEIIINRESNKISTISEEIIHEIKNKKFELEDMENEQKFLKEEIEQYKKLANIGQEDAQAILEEIKQNKSDGKVSEYIYGFIIGIVGSIIANILYKKIDIKFGKAK